MTLSVWKRSDYSKWYFFFIYINNFSIKLYYCISMKPDSSLFFPLNIIWFLLFLVVFERIIQNYSFRLLYNGNTFCLHSVFSCFKCYKDKEKKIQIKVNKYKLINYQWREGTVYCLCISEGLYSIYCGEIFKF